jgi:hypothetical protein
MPEASGMEQDSEPSERIEGAGRFALYALGAQAASFVVIVIFAISRDRYQSRDLAALLGPAIFFGGMIAGVTAVVAGLFASLSQRQMAYLGVVPLALLVAALASVAYWACCAGP